MSFLVIKICAIGCRRWLKRLSQRLINRHCPIAARAYRKHQDTTQNNISLCFVGIGHMKNLAYGGESYLQLGQMLRSLFDIHPPEPHANGSRRDDDDLVAILSQPDGRLYYRGQDGKERLMALFVHDRAGSYGTCKSKSWNFGRDGKSGGE